ncbi:LAMI_0B04280g1_1 [Lachancea mirantina]|uniref:Phospholipid scramblase n=1 Tax=Lachancea mirantina TaxID=1230905 RepID=A0A1G4IVF2_9SACH|nr:LAMI_0B04280g1_1 [Lachancea mirantina]
MIRRLVIRRFYSPPRLARIPSRRPSGAQPNLSFETNSIIQVNDPIATTILNEPTIVVERQIEMMNVFLGFEQANKYVIMDALGNRIGYMQERDFGITKAVLRQFYRLHRPFLVDVFDNWGNVLLTIKRPFSWINSHIKTILPQQADVVRGESTSPSIVQPSAFSGGPVPQGVSNLGEEGTLVGESVQNWHLWRRRYELFQRDQSNVDTFAQFAKIDAPFLSFEFPLTDQDGRILASVDRNWVGLGRELFTDTGVYVVRMDSFRSFEGVYPRELVSNRVLTLDQRAILLANAVSIDFDYFSRHSGHSGGLIGFGDYGE